MESIAAGNAGDVHHSRAWILRREESPLQIELLHRLQRQQIPDLAIFQALGRGSVDQIDSRDVLGAGDRDAGMAVSISREVGRPTARKRSEEHTSELQSHSDLVCRLLLEKKN